MIDQPNLSLTEAILKDFQTYVEERELTASDVALMQSIVVKEIASAREYQSRLAQLGPHGSMMGRVLAGVNLDPNLDPMEFSRRVQAQADYYDPNRETDFLARYQVLIDRLTSYRGFSGLQTVRGTCRRCAGEGYLNRVDPLCRNCMGNRGCERCANSHFHEPCPRCGGNGSV